MKLAICDDMPEILDHSRGLILSWPNRPAELSITTFTDGDGLAEAHSADPFDMILLDVVMPLMNGIEAAAAIRKHDSAVKIIFLTHSKEFAYDSYSVKADGYLLKPVVPSHLYACLDECAADILHRESCITVRSGGTVHRIPLHTIEHLEAQGRLVQLRLTNGKSLPATDPFYAFEQNLSQQSGFFKCHRSYIINMYKISSFTQKEVTMQSGARIPISRSLQKSFHDTYFSFMFGDLS